MATGTHPLAAMLSAAAGGTFPAVDGAVDVHPPDRAGRAAVVEFTGHAVVLTDHDPAVLIARGADGFGGAVQPDVLRWLAGGGWIGSHDAVLVARGRGGGTRLVPRADLDDHPRVARALHHRVDVAVAADDHGVVVLGRGLVGRLELSVELFDDTPGGQGHGRRLVAEGLHLVAPGELVWAQVAPGNAASLRAFLAAGFVPIGAEVLIEPT
jgi:hypothetical protein